MSNTMKWVIGVIVVLVIGYFVWSSGIIPGMSSGSQTGAANAAQSGAANAAADSSMSDATLANDVAGVDAQLKTVNPNGGAAVVAPAIQKTVVAMSLLAVKLQSRIQNVPRGTDTTAMKAAMADLSVQLSNASSNAVAAAQTKITVAQARTYIQKAYTALAAARVDLATVISAVKGK